MKLKEFINEDRTYCRVENEIKEWVEKTYDGLSIEFYPALEIVRTKKELKHTKAEIRQIIEVVNIKIGDILESHSEEIYIAERLTRIWNKHPEFNPEINNMDELKKNEKFLKYLKELIIKIPRKIRREMKHGSNKR